MRFLSLTLTNYRGIQHRHVAFAPRGVTLVEGQNEVGKTSMCEAINVLFDYQATSKAAEIRGIKPVDKDAGPEIVLTMECGPYCFTYFKRYLKAPVAELTIAAPTAAHYTGQEAHDKAKEIIAAHCDVDLWKALRMMQGNGTQLPALNGRPSLAAALNRAAGLVASDGSDATVLEAAHAEFAKYFTDGGPERVEYKRATEAVAAAAGAHQAAREQLAAVARDTERADELQHGLVELRARLLAAKSERATHEEAAARVARKRRDADTCKLALDAAEQALRSALYLREERDEQAAASALCHSTYQAARAEAETLGKRREAALAELALATTRRKGVTAHRREAAQEVDLLRADAAHLSQIGDAERLEQLLASHRELQDQADAWRIAQTAIKLNSTLLREIRDAATAVKVAEIRLREGAPQLIVTAKHPLDLALSRVGADGEAERLHLAAGDSRLFVALEALALSVADLATIEIRPATSAAALHTALQDARAGLAASCRRAEVMDLAEAEDRAHEAKSLVVRLGHADAAMARLVERGRSIAQTASDLEALRRGLGAYAAKRAPTPPLAPTIEAAQEATRAAQARLDAAADAAMAADEGASAAQASYDLADRQHMALCARLELMGEQVQAATERLARARASQPDVVLTASAALLQTTTDAARLAHATAEHALRDEGPFAAEDLLRHAVARVERLDKELRSRHDDLVALNARLETLGTQGLFEQCRELETHHERLARDHEALRRRANAAKHLFELLDACRQATQRSYVAPLKRRIEELGRHVYCASFGVDLDDELNVTTRSLDGRTVPFEALSCGAKEQLGLIARVAACGLAATAAASVPLLLDDILGHTDPTRLAGMAAILDLAGKGGQVIYLTCTPVRAGAIGEALVVAL